MDDQNIRLQVSSSAPYLPTEGISATRLEGRLITGVVRRRQDVLWTVGYASCQISRENRARAPTANRVTRSRLIARKCIAPTRARADVILSSPAPTTPNSPQKVGRFEIRPLELFFDNLYYSSSLLLLYICLYMFSSSLFAVDFIRRMKMNIFANVIVRG